MKSLIVAVTILFAINISLASDSPKLNIKFRFFCNDLSDSKTIKLGRDITSVVGTRFFDANRDTVIHIHGYTFYLQSRGAKPIIEAFIKYPREYNIIYVDYTAHTNLHVKENLKVELLDAIEHAIFENLKALKNAAGGFKYTHIVSFGLGSYVAAEVGKLFINEENYSIDRITMLDPSGENSKAVFGFWINDVKPINKDCAKFVDVIHTNGGVVGELRSLGHVDFYVNGGRTQELCHNWWQLASFAFFDAQRFLSCSHQMSWDYWCESLLNDHETFLAYKCPTCFDDNGNPHKSYGPDFCNEKTQVSMGIHTDAIANDPTMHGCYYVPTNSKSPYSMD